MGHCRSSPSGPNAELNGTLTLPVIWPLLKLEAVGLRRVEEPLKAVAKELNSSRTTIRDVS